MKHLTIIATLLTLLVISCTKSDTEPMNPFGINYSDYENADKANGFIMYQNYGGPRIDLAVDSAYLLELDSANYYKMQYYFTANDSLQLVLHQLTSDYNYHSDAASGQNAIVLSVFNRDTLKVLPSALSLQPRNETDDFTTVLNLHTSDDKGTFNGTVDSVVLVKNE